MHEPPSMEALHSALDPVEALRGEQSQLEAWVRDSVAALDALHDDLNEWQRHLTRQQAELDQREAALTEAESRSAAEGRDCAALETQLAQVREEARQLEEENAEQSQTLGDLERKLIAAQTELRAARKHADELADALDAERERDIDDHRLWAGELRDMRRLLVRQGEMLVSLGAAAPPDDEEPDAEAVELGESAQVAADDATASTNDPTAPAAEHRRRGSSRRAHRRSS
jgi:chromosome segregation ATPase